WSSSFWRPGLRRTIAAETVIFRAQGVGGANSTGGVDQHQLRIFQRGDADAVQLADGGAVAGLQGHAVDLHLALRRHQVTEAAGTGEAVLGAFAGLERCAEHARGGADRQRIPGAGDPAGRGDEASGTVLLRERARAAGRLAARFVREDPDLEDPGDARLEVVLGMAHAAARAHHLDVAGFGAALVAHAVLVGDRAL